MAKQQMILAAITTDSAIYYIVNPSDKANSGVVVQDSEVMYVPFWSYVDRLGASLNPATNNHFLRLLWKLGPEKDSSEWAAKFFARDSAFSEEDLDSIKLFLVDVPKERKKKPDLVTKSLDDLIEVKAPRSPLKMEPYDPDARDGDNDGIVQENTPWERPAATRLMDAAGNLIERGKESSSRPTGIRVVDANGNDVDYTPTYERSRTGTIGAGRQVGDSTSKPKKPEPKKPVADKPTQETPEVKPKKPGSGSALSDHGAGSLKERGMRDVRAAAAPPPPPPPPEPKKPDAPKPEVPEGEYRMSHQPSDDGPRAFDLTEDGGGDWSMPGDVYDKPNLYTGADATVRKETMEQLERVRGNPDGLVTVYRYAPEGREFEVGNWVSLSQTYARQHGESNPTPGGTVQSMQVPAKEVRFAGDDLAEFGWYPESQDSKPEVKPDSKVNLPYVPAKNILEKDLSQREKRSRDDASMMARSDLSMLSPEERSLLREYYEVETDEELLDAVVDKAIEGSRWQVRDVREGPLYVAVPERAISQVLADERMKSVFESGWSMGGDASGVRRSVEERQMGVPVDLPDELRPIYGFQLHEEDGDSVTMSAASEHYGPFVLVLKSDVRERTTMTLGDSLDDNLYAVPVDGEITDLQASAAAGDLGLLRSMEGVHNEWGDVLDRYDLQEGRDRDIWSEQRNYSEFQVHGGIRLEDVEEVVYPSWLKGRFDEFENVIAMFDKLGIKHGEDY